MTLGREPLQIVEIDFDRCSLTYGASPCTAVLGADGVRKCFNSLKTCQDPDNIALEPFTVRFTQNISDIPASPVVFPCMTGPVSTNPLEINLGGVSDRTGPLGKRARVTINLQDFTDSDLFFDSYHAERKTGAAQSNGVGYDPAERGTFFGRLRARFPYYLGRAVRIREGFVGDKIEYMRTRHYVVSEWVGPDHSGRVTITVKDILDLAENKKALCPKPSRGKLGKDITDAVGQTFTFSAPTVGEEYPTSGRASISSEIVSYTRSGDVVTLTGRGLDGSEAASHSEGDLFQEAFRVDADTIPNVANTLLTSFAGIDPAFIPISEWNGEANRWLAGFSLTTTIAKPTGVLDLMGELAQLGVMWWWDETAQRIRFRANRPVETFETVAELTEDASIIEGTGRISDLYEERLTQVIFWHGQLDASGSSEDGKNFARAFAATVDEDRHNQPRVLEIFNRWLGAGNDAVAGAVAVRLLNRYQNTPIRISFDVDGKDEAIAKVADFANVTTRLITDETGEVVPAQMQITSVEETMANHRIKVTAQTFQFVGRYGEITEDTRPDYDASSDSQKALGTYIVDENTLLFSDGTGPYLMF